MGGLDPGVLRALRLPENQRPFSDGLSGAHFDVWPARLMVVSLTPSVPGFAHDLRRNGEDIIAMTVPALPYQSAGRKPAPVWRSRRDVPADPCAVPEQGSGVSRPRNSLRAGAMEDAYNPLRTMSSNKTPNGPGRALSPAGALLLGFAAGVVLTLVLFSWLPVAFARLKFLERSFTEGFHWIYHINWWGRTMDNTWWLGVRTMQTPLDMWVFQEIIYETRPDLIIETGSHHGGAALFYATVMDALNHGRILTIDIKAYPNQPKHPRITYLVGSSTDATIVEKVKGSIVPGERVMVILDSLHNKEHVLEELRLYGPLVTKGNYLVVQDTHLNGHPIRVPFSPDPGHDGPMEALWEFLPKHPEYLQDRSREKFGSTHNPGGWLRRIRD
jgi:cephalosporin hydroxylase